MKKIKLLFLISIFVGLFADCSKDDGLLEQNDDLMLKKVMKVKVMPCTSNDAIEKAEQDWMNINEALKNANPGEVVQLGEGAFYLHKSIICWDFNGTLRGSGMGKTIIRTAPEIIFDISDCPPVNWSFEEGGGAFMLCFAHDYFEDERTVIVSNLSIIVDEPTPERPKNDGKINSLHGIMVMNMELDNERDKPVNLNVSYKNLSVTGEKDPKYLYDGYSLFSGLSAYGYSNGTFEVKNVFIENASGCIKPHGFIGEDARVIVKNSHLSSCVRGIYSFLNHSWTILNNDIEDSKFGVVMLKQNPLGEIPEGPDGVSFVKDNRIHFEYKPGLGVGIQNVNNVEIKNNTFVGSSKFGGIGGAGAINGGENWIVKDNDLCGVVPQPPFNCTIWLNKLTNSEIRNNANQVIGGPGALEPTNIIGEGRECY